MTEETGFLTETDRDFLIGKHEYTGESAKQQRYQRREAIAERTRKAFRDFQYLLGYLDEHERNRIFDVGEGETDSYAINTLHDQLVDTIAFLYLSLEGTAESEYIRTRNFRVPFEIILTQGVKKGEEARHDRDISRLLVDVEFDVNVRDGYDLYQQKRAIDKIARRDFHELTEEEMHTLLMHYEPNGPRDVLSGEEGGYERLEEIIEERREELGLDFEPAELTEEEREKFRESDDTGEE